MRPTLSVLAALLVLLPLWAQDDPLIQAARTARDPGMLEKRAADLEAQYQFDGALKLLEAAVALRGQIDGDQSAIYGLSLLKLGALERKAGHGKEAAAHYAQAVRLLPGRPETGQVFLYLGITSLNKKDGGKTVAEYLERARSLDFTLTGPVLMWTALEYERQDQLDQAEATYKLALAAETPGSIEEFETLTLYGRFLEQHGRDSEAAVIQARASDFHVRPSAIPASSVGGTYRIGGGVTAPAVIFKQDPAYSEEARIAKISTSIVVQLVVGADGTPANIKVVRKGGFGLDDCAISTIAKWRFKPGEKAGSPVPVFATVEVNFRLL